MLTRNVFHIIAIGKNKDAFIDKGIEEYTRNIRKYGELKWNILKESQESAPLLRTLKEGEALLQALKQITSPYVIALSEEGKCKGSVETAALLKGWMSSLNVVFLIGGPFGLSSEVKGKAHQLLSLSPLTFNHQLVRLILAEQIYRWLSILYKSSYHH